MRMRITSAVLAVVFMVNVSNVVATTETKKVSTETINTVSVSKGWLSTTVEKISFKNAKEYVQKHKLAFGVSATVLAGFWLTYKTCTPFREWVRELLGITDEDDEATQEKMMAEFYATCNK